MDVSIIFVNYRTSKILIEAISSVIAHTKDLSYEIIIVDNNSQDDSEKELKDCFGEQIRYIQLPENVGFGRANNVGAQNAQGHYLFLLNPDTLLINDAINILVKFLDKNPNVAIAGGNLFSVNLKPNASFERKLLFPSIFMEFCYLSAWIIPRLIYGRNFEFNHTNHPLEVGFIIGADMMIRAKVFHALKGFDPDFFMYSEETDLSFRAIKAGYKSVCVPSAHIIHMEGKSSQFKENQMRMRYQSRTLYYQKHFSRNYFYAANLIHWVMIWSRIIGYTILLNTKQRGFWFSNLRIFKESIR